MGRMKARRTLKEVPSCPRVWSDKILTRDGMEMEWYKRHITELTYKGLDNQLNVHVKERHL